MSTPNQDEITRRFVEAAACFTALILVTILFYDIYRNRKSKQFEATFYKERGYEP
jgi:hypothetical protein